LGTDKNKNVSLPNPLHPMMQRAYSILEPMFIKDIIPRSGHGILASEDNWVALLKTVPVAAERVSENLEKKWKKADSTPVEKWAELKQHLEVFISKAKGGGKNPKTMSAAERNKLETWCAETVFRYTYPRLDINVSKMQNHLLKSPFCVHPKTGRVCIPMQVDKVDSFDPFSVPTLPQLMNELDAYNSEHPDAKVDHEWQKTSLKESFAPFIKNFMEPMFKDLRKQQRNIAEEQAAKTGDF
jgi:DNA primase small subunit